MALKELLDQIDELQARIGAAGPLSSGAKRRLDYRFRLDWNYHSNVMEGSSLTKQETRTIMLGILTLEAKPKKDVLEMSGHDELVSKLLGLSRGDLNLSEGRIKEIHKAIVVEEGQERKERVGRWKTNENYIINYRGERIDFTPPNDVPDAIHRLLDRTKAEIERIEANAREAQHPALLAFDFHRSYVSIHPFHDGNGRTARILSNVILMRFGFPPVIVKVDEKEAYNRIITEVQDYGAPTALFSAFMAERLIRSQQLALDIAEGKEVVDDDDISKRAALLFARAERERMTHEERRQLQRSRSNDWIRVNASSLTGQLERHFGPLSKFYRVVSFRFWIPIEGMRGAMPAISAIDIDRLMELRVEGDAAAPLGIFLIFSGFLFGDSETEERLEGSIDFTEEHVVMSWPGVEFSDRLSYTDPLSELPMHAMKCAALDLLHSIEQRIEADSSKQK